MGVLVVSSGKKALPLTRVPGTTRILSKTNERDNVRLFIKPRRGVPGLLCELRFLLNLGDTFVLDLSHQELQSINDMGPDIAAD